MILSRKQIEVWKNSTIPVDGYGPLIRNLLDTIDDLLADRPAPSGEAPQAGEDDLAQAREFWKTLPHCCGYPQCDGDLVGIEHDSKCPLYGKKELTLIEFAAMFGAAERNRARREALAVAIKAQDWFGDHAVMHCELRDNERCHWCTFIAELRALAADPRGTKEPK